MSANGKADLQISSLKGGLVPKAGINNFALRGAEPHRSDSTIQMFRLRVYRPNAPCQRGLIEHML